MKMKLYYINLLDAISAEFRQIRRLEVYTSKKNECSGKLCNSLVKLSGSFFSVHSGQDTSQTMKESNSNEVHSAFARTQRPFL